MILAQPPLLMPQKSSSCSVLCSQVDAILLLPSRVLFSAHWGQVTSWKPSQTSTVQNDLFFPIPICSKSGKLTVPATSWQPCGIWGEGRGRTSIYWASVRKPLCWTHPYVSAKGLHLWKHRLRRSRDFYTDTKLKCWIHQSSLFIYHGSQSPHVQKRNTGKVSLIRNPHL